MAGNVKVHVLLALGYGAGLRAGEVVRLRVGDIDSAQNIIRIVQAKGRAPAECATPLRRSRSMRSSSHRRSR
jgi:integrase/recombinase XerD